MVGIAAAVVSAIPSLINLFTGDKSRTDSVIDLTNVASKALGINSSSPKDILQHLRDNPEAVVKLKELETEAKRVEIEVMQVDLEDTLAKLADVSDARKRQSSHEEITGATDYNLYILAWTIVFGFFALIGTIIFVSLPKGSNDIVYMLFGTLTAGFGSVMQYFFGSSKGSADKTKMLSKQM